MYNFQLTLALLYIHIMGIKLSAYLMRDMKDFAILTNTAKKKDGMPIKLQANKIFSLMGHS